ATSYEQADSIGFSVNDSNDAVRARAEHVHEFVNCNASFGLPKCSPVRIIFEPIFQGLCVGRRRISLMKDCGAWVTIMATAWATSAACSIFSAFLPACELKSVCTEPGATTETRILWARSSSATE